ncbi:ABC transporter substrate-binding protein [Litchfieldia salsa]|uniref:Carbohydrate ABC transporter substrate-binding protein, CUT1 family n=1 Tax=Litchfieldia salsa TaxID=930152 RepID=A0A1H0VLA6_9BACI|nr:ABC transporter substrate-binding protein [Litchfieldia salsa]SDP78975.1 carbohydrate ABC transporter substrate-binding protein, CUT1 family [Litchfieldia salsa]
MKKLFGFLLMLTFALVLSACNSSDSTGSETSSGSNEVAADTGKIELTYWYAWGDKIGENNENLVKMFNESQDKIHVTAEYQGTYDDLHAKTQAAFAAKNAPEVTMNEIASIGVFAKSGMTQDLTPFVEQDDMDLDDFNPGLMGNSYVDDKLYGLPYLRSTPILYMNTTMLEEAGLDPAGPKDWAEFEEYLRALTVEGKTVGMTMPVNIWMYEAFVAQGEGQMISDDETKATFNEEAGVEALEFWKKLEKEGIIKVPGGEEAGEVAKQDFANSRSAMIFSSTADLSYNLSVAEEQGFELNTAFMPSNKVHGVPTGGANLVMTAGLDEEKQKAAWEFIKWMTAKEQTIYASKFTGYLPSRLSAVDSDEMKALYEERPQFKVAVDQLQYGHARPMAEAYPEIATIVTDAIARTLLEDDLSPQDALDAAAEKANQLLK